jgi:hypothetical protein
MNKRSITILVVVLILLCCCCAGGIGAWQFGDQVVKLFVGG